MSKESLPPDLIDAYWRAKAQVKRADWHATLPIWDLLLSLAKIIGDNDWPDHSMLDKLFIDKPTQP